MWCWCDMHTQSVMYLFQMSLSTWGRSPWATPTRRQLFRTMAHCTQHRSSCNSQKTRDSHTLPAALGTRKVTGKRKEQCRRLRIYWRNQQIRTMPCYITVLHLSNADIRLTNANGEVVVYQDCCGAVNTWTSLGWIETGSYTFSDWPFCVCATNLKSSMCSEITKQFSYKCHGLFDNSPVITTVKGCLKCRSMH